MPVGAIRRAFFDPETVSVHSQNKYADDLSHRIDTLISIKTAMQQLINTLRGLPRKVTKMQSEDLEKAAGSRDGLCRRQHPFHLSQRHRDLTAQSYPFAPAVLAGVFPLARRWNTSGTGRRQAPAMKPLCPAVTRSVCGTLLTRPAVPTVWVCRSTTAI